MAATELSQQLWITPCGPRTLQSVAHWPFMMFLKIPPMVVARHMKTFIFPQ
jgi:hypothetical protein